MLWWQWLVLGALLLGAELVLIDAEFFLVFIGVSAICVGLVGLTPLPIPFWGHWILFSIFAVASLLLFRKRFYRKFRGDVPGHPDGVAGEVAVVDEAIEPGGEGVVMLRGARWNAQNVSDESLGPGARVVVEKVTGLLLLVRAVDRAARS